MILSCDFLTDNSHIITTTLEGDINMHSVKDDLGIVRHETLIHPHKKSNVVFCSRVVRESPNEVGKFLVGSESKAITKFEFEPSMNSIEKLGEFKGHHTGAVRNI
jgi:hypothetical protein